MKVKEELRAIRQELYDIRHDIHHYPEVSGKEFRTAGVIRKVLEAEGLSWQAIEQTGTVAELEGGSPGPTIILRADIDALPIKEKNNCPFKSSHDGVMHACGHDLHLTALLGAVKILKRHSEKLKGNVRFVFQQAEEFGHGSQYFLNAGVTDDVSRIYGFHVSPEAELGKVILTEGADAASCDHFIVRIKGRSAHISKPHQGSDATLAAASIVTNLHELKNRFDPMAPVMIGVGSISSGTTWNVISDYAEIEGTVRTLSMDLRETLLQQARDVIMGTAAIYGVEAEAEFEMFSPCLINDHDAYRTMHAAAAETVGGSHIINKPVPLGFGGDDFAAFSQKVKGCFIHVGTRKSTMKGSAYPLHSELITFPDEAILTGAEILIRCALINLYEGDI